MIEAARAAQVPIVALISSVGCDMAEHDSQPRLREFVDIETEAMRAKGDSKTEMGHSPVITRYRP